ncbi:Uncharacterised protein [Salmonella enterica subsp. houtenae]|nr:Uncharacterised protein [Salmonella enterica subsp. houtenae]
MDDCACAAGSLQSGGIVVRNLVIAQRAGERSGIVDSGGDNRCSGERNVGRIDGCGWACIAGIVSRGHSKLFAAKLWRCQINTKFTVAIRFALANDVA